jgi:hypothetical protein
MAQLQRKIQKSEPAPFEGILVPYETYRKMNADILEMDNTKDALSTCLSNSTGDSVLEVDWRGYTISFGVGLVGGMLLLSYLKK